MHQLRDEAVAVQRQSFGGEEEGLLGRSDSSKLKLSQEHFLMVGGAGESKQVENKTESIFGCKQLASSGGGLLRLKSGGEMFGLGGGGGERPLGEILTTERGERLGNGSETALGERLRTERLGAERLATERLDTERLGAERFATERLATERLGAERLGAERLGAERIDTERLARVAFNEDRLGIKAKLSVEETGVLSR